MFLIYHIRERGAEAREHISTEELPLYKE